jgi:ribose transport system substrate-binding protein
MNWVHGRSGKHRPRGGIRSLVVVVAFAAGGLGLQACGSSGDSSSGTTSTAAPAQGASSPGVATAKKNVEALRERPTKLQLPPPITKAIPAGKHIVWIRCGAPACTVLTNPMKASAATLGWKLTIIDGGATPESNQSAWNQVLRIHPDGVLYSGFPRVVFNDQLKKAAASGTVVVSWSVPDPPGDGIKATIYGKDDNDFVGGMKADYAIADSGGKANAVQFVASEYPTQLTEAAYIERRFKSECPDCKIDTQKVAAATIGKTLPQTIVGYVRAHPKVDYIIVGFDDMAAGLPGALQDAGLAQRVKLIGQNASPESRTDLQSGQMSATSPTGGPEIAYRAMDIFARSFLKLDVGEAKTPFWLLTKDTAGDLKAPLYAVVEDYAAEYKALWNK